MHRDCSELLQLGNIDALTSQYDLDGNISGKARKTLLHSSLQFDTSEKSCSHTSHRFAP